MDVIGIVIEMSPVSKITISDGSTRDKRIITIADDSNHSVGVIIYDDLTQINKFSVGKLVAFKFTRVGDFNTCSLNSSVSPFDIIFELEHSVANTIINWYESKVNEKIKPLTVAAGISNSFG